MQLKSDYDFQNTEDEKYFSSHVLKDVKWCLALKENL